MTRKQVILLAALALLAVAVAWLALRNPGPPFLPADETHRVFDSADACLACHGPGGGSPRSPAHPLGTDCMRCHAPR